MLSLTDVVIRYGSAVAVDGVTLEVQQGEMVALVGPNGAGKSSLVNAASGIVAIASGRLDVGGRVAQVPEGRLMFADMSVEDNLKLGAWKAKDKDPSMIYSLLPEVKRFRKQKAGTLSGGQQQMVAIGRALMAQPDLLLIDELSLGLAPIVVAELAGYLTTLNREHGTTIVLIEQEIELAFRLCTRGYVLEAGRVVASGLCSDLEADPALADAYFGGLDAVALPAQEEAS
jgi:branched-chain amino acid transport system ATP-binding protein